MSTDDNGVLLEAIQDDLRRLAEAMADVPAQVRAIDARLVTVEADVQTIKAVITDISAELRDHEHRITRLEQAA
jgi:hypothetical protein